MAPATGEAPTVVLSDDPGSSDRIAQFASDSSHWLAVGVYATGASTRNWIK